jgi:molecular chaperone GrpE
VTGEAPSINVSDKDAKKEASAEEKLAEMQDRYLRLSAEFDNYRKRTLREKMDLAKHGGENILKNIIPVLDDFERALKLMETATDCAAMKSGIDLIYIKFSDFLRQNGIREIESLNKDFDVDHHEAVTKVSVQDESMKGKVVEVIVKGYWIHDKVLRFSKVVVGE